MNKFQELIQLLTDLKRIKYKSESEYQEAVYLVDDILETLFKIEIEKPELSLSDRNKIGSLIADTLNSFGCWINYSADQIHEANIDDYKVKRSGLEFILENYRESPNGEQNCLGAALEYFRETEDIEGWDEQFKNISSSYDSNAFYKNSDKPTLITEAIQLVPQSHWWWKS